MASAYGPRVQNWRARVVTDVTAETATTITIRVRQRDRMRARR